MHQGMVTRLLKDMVYDGKKKHYNSLRKLQMENALISWLYTKRHHK